MLCHVKLSDGVAHQGLNHGHAALPAVPDLLGARQPAAVELEVLGDQFLGQQPGASVNDPPPCPVLPVGEVRALPQCGERRQEIGLPHDQLVGSRHGDAESTHPAGPVEARRLGRQAGEGAQVVGQLGVAALHHVPVRARQPGLQRHNARRGPGVLVRFPAVGQGEHRCDVTWVGRQDLGVLVLAVVGLIGQSDARLVQVQQVASRVLRVGVHVEPDTAADPGALACAHRPRQGLAVTGIVDSGQFLAQRLHAALADDLLVQEAGVEVADPALVSAGRIRTRRGRLVEQFANLDLGAIEQGAEGSVGGAVRWHLVAVEPAAVDMTEQIVLWADTTIYIGEIKAGTGGW